MSAAVVKGNSEGRSGAKPNGLAPKEVPAPGVDDVGNADGTISACACIWKYQNHVHAFYTNKHVEISVAFLIVLNFLVQCVQAQVDPFKDRHELLWSVFETFFNVVFLMELSVNMYGTWCRPFWANNWNRFDFLVVSIGLCDLCQIPLPGPLSSIRLLRAFRVFRLFARVESMRKTVDSIFHALPGVASAFAIVLLVLAIYSVLAVDFFKDLFEDCKDDPADEVANTPRGLCFGEDYYGNFLKSMYTLFQILTGESWSEAAVRPVLQAYSGVLELTAASTFFISFILINGIIIINVVVAFLMDGMSSGGDDNTSSQADREVIPIKSEDPGAVVTLRSDVQALRTKMDNTVDGTREILLALLQQWPDLKEEYEEEHAKHSSKHTSETQKLQRKASHHRTRSFTQLPEATGRCAAVWKYQNKVRKLYYSPPVEISVACLIAAAFSVQCLNAQIDPNGDRHEKLWEVLDAFFNVVFAIELAANMYGSWCKPFWISPWNRFDFLVVSIGVLSLCQLPLPGPMGKMAKLLRAFRVFRLFGRIESLNTVVTMIQRALPGVMSAFLVAIITLCIYAILSVDFFKDVYSDCNPDWSSSMTKRGQCFGQDYYGNFLKALYTLFQILTGESWSEAAVRPILHFYEDDAAQLGAFAAFFISFYLLNSVVILNVVVAFLIDGMGDPFVADEEDDEDKQQKKPFSAQGELARVKQDVASFQLEFQQRLDKILKRVRPVEMSSI